MMEPQTRLDWLEVFAILFALFLMAGIILGPLGCAALSKSTPTSGGDVASEQTAGHTAVNISPAITLNGTTSLLLLGILLVGAYIFKKAIESPGQSTKPKITNVVPRETNN